MYTAHSTLIVYGLLYHHSLSIILLIPMRVEVPVAIVLLLYCWLGSRCEWECTIPS